MSMIDRSTRIYTLTVFGISLAVYILTCCRTVFVGDSGELTVALITGGIAHPPGYPMYTILGYIWLKVFFFLSPALAANLFSAAASAVTTGLLFLILRLLADRRFPSLLLASLSLLFSFAYPIWSSATNAEVYAFSGLLYMAALYAVIRFYQDGSTRLLLVTAFLCGLTLTHHFSSGVIVAGLTTAMVYRRKEMTMRSIITAITVMILPLTLYIYLFLRFDPNLPINWMSEKSVPALWSMISGEIYRQFVGWPTIGDVFLFAKKTATASLAYFGPGVVLFVLPGLLIALRKRLQLVLLLSVPAILNLLMVAAYHIPDYEGYLIPSLIFAVILILMCFDWLWVRYHPNPVIVLIVAGILVILPMLANYTRCDLSQFDLAKKYGKDLLDSAAENSLLFLKSDNGSHAVLYLHYGENYRPDLRIYSANSTLTRLKNQYGNKDFADIMGELETGTDRIFWGTEYVINQGMNPSASEKSLRGMLYGRLGDDNNPEVSQRIAAFTRYDLSGIDLKGDLKAQQIYLEYQLHRLDGMMPGGLGTALTQSNVDLLAWAEQLDDPMTCLSVAQFFRTRGMIDQSLKWVELAVSKDPFSYEQKDLYVNLGTIYRQAGNLGMAGQVLSKALQIDPDYPPARYNANLVRAEVALQKKDWSEALDAFQDLTEIEPGNPLHYFNMAVIYERLPGRIADAIEHYRKFINRAGEDHPQAVTRARDRIKALSSSTVEDK